MTGSKGNQEQSESIVGASTGGRAVPLGLGAGAVVLEVKPRMLAGVRSAVADPLEVRDVGVRRHPARTVTDAGIHILGGPNRQGHISDIRHELA